MVGTVKPGFWGDVGIWFFIGIIVVLVILLLTGWIPGEFGDGDIQRWVDDEAKVVCWLWHDKGGISCLPLSETGLGR